MSRINVKTKPGRIARTSPRGEFIPHDRFIPVARTPYIERLIHVHGDLEVQEAPVAKVAPKNPERVTADK